jgi:protein TonB
MNSASLSPIENRNAGIGWLVSIVFHGLLFLLFFFALAWKRQIPPPPEYGIEVNFGTTEEGFGETQNLTPPSPEPTPEQAQTSPSQPEQTEQNIQPEAEPEKVITGQDEIVAVAPKPVAKATETSPDPVKTEPAKPSPEALFPSNKGGSSGNNNGNKPGTVGDMGKINGNPDARGIYDGNPGKGNGGSSLDMSGWKWDARPQINDESAEEGKIVFQIKVDEEGNIVAVNVLEKTVPPALVKKYQKEVERLTFSRTAGGSNGEGATGRITFIITSK